MTGTYTLEEQKGQTMMHTYNPQCPHQVSTFYTLWNQRNNPDKILKLMVTIMPLFHQRIKPRLGLGPLIVDSLGKKLTNGLQNWIGFKVPNWSGTKNRLSHFSGRFEPRSCRTQTDWVPGRLRPPGTKPRLTQD